MKNMKKRANEAAKRLLEMKGYEIVETSNKTFELVAIENGTLVFCKVELVEDVYPEAETYKAKRQKYEMKAVEFLATHDYRDMPIRFDVISLMVVGDGRAMVRHYIDAMA